MAAGPHRTHPHLPLIHGTRHCVSVTVSLCQCHRVLCQSHVFCVGVTVITIPVNTMSCTVAHSRSVSLCHVLCLSLCHVLCVGVIVYSVYVMYSMLVSLLLLYQCTLCHVHNVMMAHRRSVSWCHVLSQCHFVMFGVRITASYSVDVTILCTLPVSLCCVVHYVTLSCTSCQCHCVVSDIGVITCSTLCHCH